MLSQIGLAFLVYSWATAYKLQMGTAALGMFFFAYVVYKTNRSSPYRSVGNILASYAKSVTSIFLSAAAALVLPVFVALFLTSPYVNRHMAWFAREWYGALIFCPISLIGIYGVQYLSYLLPGPQHHDMEYGTFISLSLSFVISTFLTTKAGVASSYIFWIYCSVILVSAVLNEVIVSSQPRRKTLALLPKVHAATYAVSAIPLALLYTDYTYSMIDIFVPLTGRMGVDTPVDIIISIVFGMISFMIFLPGIAHVHRFGKQFLRRIIVFLAVLQVAVLAAVYVSGGSHGGWAFPYDEYHPKRL